ncbi:MAG: RidA family protein [Phycisphaerales bacterium]
MTTPAETIVEKLRTLGLALPAPAKPVAAYIPTKRVGDMLYVSGQVPWIDGKLMATGSVPTTVSMEVAQACARQCVLNALAAVGAAMDAEGGIGAIRSVVRVGCFVACEPGFTDHPKVANGASDLLVVLFGERGRHTRAAVGAPSLPLGVPVEVEFLFEVNGPN